MASTVWTSEFLLLQSMVALGLVLVITTLFTGQTRLVRVLALVPVMFLGFRYMGWRTFATMNFEDGWLVAALSVLLLVVELLLFFVNTLSSWILFSSKTNRSPQADRMQEAVLRGTFTPSVDVFIPTVNEGVEILRRTVTGCQQMDYPTKHIHLLDDGRRPEVEALAAELGVGYFKREDNKHFKAGNVNNALWQTDKDLICFFDADFVPAPHFLTRVVGFFQDEKVALVQTPQSFYNNDLVETNLGLEGFTNEQDLFFRSLQPGRDAFNAVICCGTGFVLRRDRLEALGGMPTETITEDLMTSVYLQAQGYEVVYLNEALAFGEAPNRSVDHLKQRVRWARGIMQTLFTNVNPITCKNLTFAQRFFHLNGVLYWVMSIPRLIVLLMPLTYLLFDLIVIQAEINTVFCYFLPFYIASLAMFSWLNSGRRSPFWSDVYEMIPLFHLIPNVIATFINPFGLGFKVTPKGVTSDKLSTNWEVLTPCLAIIALYAVGLVRLFVEWGWGVNASAAVLNLVWGTYAVGILWMVCMAVTDVPQRRQSLRLKQPWRYSLTAGPLTALTGQLTDLTEEGVTIVLPRAQWDGGLAHQQKGRLSLPELQLYDLPVRFAVREKKRKTVEVAVIFGALPQAQYALLIKGVFARLAFDWEHMTLSEFRFLWLFVKTPLRLYPLARA